MGNFDTLLEQQQEQAEKPFDRNLYAERQQQKNQPER